MEPSRRGIISGALICLALCGFAGSAHAFWTGEGAGQAAAFSATIDPPVVDTPVATNSSVTLTWAAPVVPGPGTVDYVIERRPAGSDPWSSACGTAPAVRLSATSCSESPSDGTWEWRVVAYFRSWTATSDPTDAVEVGETAASRPPGG